MQAVHRAGHLARCTLWLMWQEAHISGAAFLRDPGNYLLSSPHSRELPATSGGSPAPWGSQTVLRSALGSNGQTLLLPHSCLPLLLAAELRGSWHLYLGLSLKFSAALCPWAQFGGSYAPSSRVTYIFNCPKMDTHAAGVAYQLARQPKICIL